MTSPLLKMMRTIMVYRTWMLLAIVLGFITIGSGIGLLMTAAYLISKAALHPSIADLQVGIVGVRFFGISRGLFRYFERLVTHDITFRLLAGFRVWFYKNLLPLAPARLMEFRSADLLSRIVSDIESLKHLFIRVLYPPLVALLTSLLMWFLLGVFDLRLGLTILIALLFTGTVLPGISYYLSHRFSRDFVEARSELTVHVLDGVQGLPEILANNQQDRFSDRLDELNRTYHQHQKKLALVSGMNEALTGLCMMITVIVFYLLSVPLVRGDLLNGVYTAVITLGIMASFEAVWPLPEAFQFLKESTTSFNRLNAITEANPYVSDKEITETAIHSYDLRISNLNFTYPGATKPALDTINLHLPFGKQIAIVGQSGAGKSTIASLLLRFWEYQQGEIEVGGVSIRNYAQDRVRSLFSLVSHTTHIFNDTIRNNLLLAAPGCSDAQIMAVLKQVNLEELVLRLSMGLDTVVGDFGVRMSGGERQRLAVARALMYDAPIWILDEPAVHLDVRNEEQIRNLIQKRKGNRSILWISHSLRGLENTDEIIVLQEGRIWEHGHYDDLIASRGLFFDLWSRQHEEQCIQNLSP